MTGQALDQQEVTERFQTDTEKGNWNNTATKMDNITDNRLYNRIHKTT